MVSVLAFYSDDPSLIPAGYLNLLYVKMKINEKEAGLAHLLLKKVQKRLNSLQFCIFTSNEFLLELFFCLIN